MNQLYFLKELLEDGVVKDQLQHQQTVTSTLVPQYTLDSDAAQWFFESPGGGRRKTPGSDWMAERLEPMLRDILGPDAEFGLLFDRFEFLLALVAASRERWVPIGRFCYRGGLRGDRILGIFESKIHGKGEGHPWLKAGLFEGSFEKLSKALTMVLSS